MRNNNKKGISLIVLVITIIVIIILAGAIILSLSSNNPILQATKAAFLSDVSNFKSELTLYEVNQLSDKMGIYDCTLLQADDVSVTYDGNVDNSKTMYDLIPALRNSTKYAGQFQVIDGELVFQGSDVNRQNWSTEAGFEVGIAGEPKVAIVAPGETEVISGTDIVYTVKFSSNAALTTVDLTGKVEVLDNNGVALSTQPTVVIGTVSGTSSNAIRQVDVTIKTNSLVNGSYKLKIKSGSVINANNISNSLDTISLIGFDILDNIPPANPSMSSNPTAWTNGNVSVTISYSTDSVVKEYSLDAATWNTYTNPVVVTENNVTVYAKGKDAAGNESAQSTLTVTNIDRTLPTVAYGTNGGTSGTASTTVTISDLGGSSINTSTLQYVWDTQNTVTPTSGWATFTNGATLTKTAASGTYYLWIKGSDNAGNNLVSKTNAFNMIIVVSNFNYTGSVQTFVAPYNGNYQLELWGAQGGNDTSNTQGGKGGYSKGTVALTSGQTIYVYVGGQGATSSFNSGNGSAAGWNGGGTGGYGSGGGGATDIRVGGTALTNRVIVAGGGGGAAGWSSNFYIGGAGGGLTGVTGTGEGTSYTPAYGGTQTAGGAGGNYSTTQPGSLGQGGASCTGSGGGAGGGGYYGGGAGVLSGGGGGSGYVGTLSNSNTIAGNLSFISPSGSSETGHTGNGYARITAL